MEYAPDSFLDLTETDHAGLFESGKPVWSALSGIADYLAGILGRVEGSMRQGSIHSSAVVGERVFLAPGARIEANAVVNGPAWIGPGSVVRSGAYLREHVLVGSDCVLGNASEFKNCLLFNRCEVPHFNYVGDSILGFKAHLGAGAICSNVRLDRRNVTVRDGEGGRIDTGLGKFGAVIGDRTEIGCNSVLSPGTLLGRDCILYPLVSWQGVLGERCIVKGAAAHQIVERRG